MTERGWQHQYTNVNGIRMHYVEQGEGFPVVLCHGFPETWYSWRYQIPVLANAGLWAIAPDLRGYGETDKPAEVEQYDIPHLVGDIVGLLNSLGLEKAVLVGHDWGSNIIWMVALMHPDRVERVVSLAIPYRGGPGLAPTKVMAEMPDQRFAYALYFQKPGEAEAFFATDLAGNLRRLYEFCAADPHFLSEQDFQVFLDAFEKGGLTGPINFYRNIDRNWETTRHLADKQMTCPALLIMADKQRTPLWPGAPWTPLGYQHAPFRPQTLEGLERWVPNLCLHLITDCGHWVQQEKPEQVNTLLLDFLTDLARK